MEEEKEIEEMNQAKQPHGWETTYYSALREKKSERKQHFLQHKGNHSNNKEVYTDGSQSTGRKVG